MTNEQLQEQLNTLTSKLADIRQIADAARAGQHPASWRKDWQRNEWTKVYNLSDAFGFTAQTKD